MCVKPDEEWAKIMDEIDFFDDNDLIQNVIDIVK